MAVWEPRGARLAGVLVDHEREDAAVVGRGGDVAPSASAERRASPSVMLSRRVMMRPSGAQEPSGSCSSRARGTCVRRPRGAASGRRGRCARAARWCPRPRRRAGSLATRLPPRTRSAPRRRPPGSPRSPPQRLLLPRPSPLRPRLLRVQRRSLRLAPGPGASWLAGAQAEARQRRAAVRIVRMGEGQGARGGASPRGSTGCASCTRFEPASVS